MAGEWGGGGLFGGRVLGTCGVWCGLRVVGGSVELCCGVPGGVEAGVYLERQCIGRSPLRIVGAH